MKTRSKKNQEANFFKKNLTKISLYLKEKQILSVFYGE